MMDKKVRRRPETKASLFKKQSIDRKALIRALQEYVLAEREMTQSQVNAALALLKLAEVETPKAAGMTHEDFLKDLD